MTLLRGKMLPKTHDTLLSPKIGESKNTNVNSQCNPLQIPIAL